jgi:SWI/SNF-related matrix-associated actin-dependent regulator of chromatin subfamily A-like protein 1
MDGLLHASLEHGEAVLSFPYDDRLRKILRAIPGRRWDPARRAWILPLDPDRAEALARLFEGLPLPPVVSEPLARALARHRNRRPRDECVLDVARPDESWWLTFATDRAPEIVEALLEHPDAITLPTIGRALIPLDSRASLLVNYLPPTAALKLRLSEDAAHALTEVSQGRSAQARAGARAGSSPGAMNYDVELRRDRRKEEWLLIASHHAPLARVLAGQSHLRALDGPGNTFALAAVERDAHLIAELIDQVEPSSVEPRAQSWIARATTWHGTIEVAGPPEEPVFLLLGDPTRLPPTLREQAVTAPGGVTVPLTLDSWRTIETSLRGSHTAATRRCVAALEEGRPAPPAVLEMSTIHEDPTFVLAPGHDPSRLDAFGALPGATHPHVRRPRAPRLSAHAHSSEHRQLPAIRADPFCVEELDRFLTNGEVWVEPEALVELQRIREEHAHAAGLVALSAATNAHIDIPTLQGELKPFQRAGVSYLLAQRRAFLADEQGLGKTIEALATLEADNAYPAIVVCPASLKLNWMREISRWLPHRSSLALSGLGPTGTRQSNREAPTEGDAPLARAAGEDVAGSTMPVSEITVLNYDILAARAPQLAAMQPRALVLDESHYCKNAAAKRTQAVARLATSIPADGLVLALTGTPVMNRPPELISQLRIIGRLADFGSGAQFGRRFKGPDAHVRLHWHLRSRCFVRRLKADVLPQLPPKTRAVVPVELDNETEYRLAETDVIAWLRSQPLDLSELDAKVAAALRAERLVRLNALKQLAARGKLHAALAWIHDFCSSGERLVVFASHREIQRAVIDRFPHALHILGADTHAARDASVHAFQAAGNADNQLIVCSIEVAGQGLTLTQASNVAFLELDWTPAKHDQAEDRLHRIGQIDAVNAWYLLAAGTIDETIANLLERKRAVINAVTDGRPEDEENVIDALARELAGEPYRHLRAVA